MRLGMRPGWPWARAGAALAVACLVGGGTLATPAHAAGGVDLQVSVDQVTFGAGSAVVLHSFAVTNAGTVDAAGLTATIDLISGTAVLALTFSPQINGCALVNPAELRCPLPDLAASGTTSQDFVAKAIEAQPVPGGVSPVPMPMTVKVVVTSDQPDDNFADNAVTSGAILRTVHSGATDLVAAAEPIDLARDVVDGDTLVVRIGLANRGPSGGDLGEIIMTFTAPSGTQWERSALFDVCAPLITGVEYRCTTQGSNPPDQEPIQFFEAQLKIIGPTIGVGEFRVNGMGGELKPADNVAKIAQPGAVPTGTPSPKGTPTSGSAGPLPRTGMKTGLIAGVGAVIIVLGAGLVVLGRRRRDQTAFRT